MRLFRKTAHVPIDHQYFLSLLGGAEAGIATTTAIVIALLIEELSVSIIATTAVITVCVQAFNSAASRYVGMRTSNEIENEEDHERFQPLMNAMMQYIAHFSVGLLPIMPVLFVERDIVIAVSCGVAFITTLIVGTIQGKFIKLQASTNLVEMIIICSLVILVGVGAGFLAR